MEQLFYLLAKTVSVLISVVSFAMLLRVVIPWFVDPMESRIYAVICLVTEPFIVPVRVILEKLDIGQNSPIDWSFMITYLLFSIIQMILPAI